jgi:hypothetical protein
MNLTDTQLIQTILQILISVAVPLVTAMVIAGGNLLIQRIKMSMSSEQLVFADMLVGRFVSAAQQYDLSGMVAQTGKEKKAWVVQRVAGELAKRGINIDTSLLADMVEANILKGAKEPITPNISTTVVNGPQYVPIEDATQKEPIKYVPLDDDTPTAEKQQ